MSGSIATLGRRVLNRIGVTARQPDPSDLKAINVGFVNQMKARMPHDEAMETAIGGSFDLIGAVEMAVLRHFGLSADGYLIDVGCGSGRLARPLSGWLRGAYLGIDLVPDLIAHARRIAGRPDWRFEVIENIGIPELDRRADVVCFFSVLTHLHPEQSYWYLEEARRVLKPGGAIVFSFLELRDPVHLQIFRDTVDLAKKNLRVPMNTFIDRDSIAIWARELSLDVVDIIDGSTAVVPEGALGQSICVLRKPG